MPAPATWPFEGLDPNAYGMIMADPPWRFATYSENGRGKSAEQHYDTMTLDQIKALPVADLATREGAFLWLWVTTPMYDLCREVVDSWGFKYVTQGTWVKTTKDRKGLAFGTGYVLRSSHEPFIIAKVGKPKVASKSVRSVIMSPRREHSRKPEEGYVEAAKLAGDVRKADLFSRETRDGWDNWGNEAKKFDLPLSDNDNQVAVELAA